MFKKTCGVVPHPNIKQTVPSNVGMQILSFKNGAFYNFKFFFLNQAANPNHINNQKGAF